MISVAITSQLAHHHLILENEYPVYYPWQMSEVSADVYLHGFTVIFLISAQKRFDNICVRTTLLGQFQPWFWYKCTEFGKNQWNKVFCKTQMDKWNDEMCFIYPLC